LPALAVTAGKTLPAGWETAAFVCENMACQLPVREASDVSRLLFAQ
jgi:uncharacterized protein YyaL (SSP411 family)